MSEDVGSQGADQPEVSSSASGAPDAPSEPDYIPPSEDQLKWIEEHKQPELDPEEARHFVDTSPRQIGEELGLHPDDLTDDPMQFIENVKKIAEERGGVVHELYGTQLKPEHICHCASCYRIWFPYRKQTPGHFGTRFGDAILQVFKGEYDQEGAEKLMDVVEVDCDEGYAIRLSDPPHICHNCWQGPCLWKDRGEFSVVGIDPHRTETEVG